MIKVILTLNLFKYMYILVILLYIVSRNYNIYVQTCTFISLKNLMHEIVLKLNLLLGFYFLRVLFVYVVEKSICHTSCRHCRFIFVYLNLNKQIASFHSFFFTLLFCTDTYALYFLSVSFMLRQMERKIVVYC